MILDQPAATSTNPRISVVIPTRNTRELTLACLAALARSASDGSLDVEIIVVDDGGNDGTREAIAQRYPPVVLIRNAERGGFTVSANRGIAAAAADVILVLNSDTEVEPATLSTLVDAFERDSRLGVAGGSLRYPGGEPQWSGGAAPSLLWLTLLASDAVALLRRVLTSYRRLRDSGPRRIDWVSGAAMAIRRNAWRDTGPFDERFRFYAQDLDFCLRASERGWSVRLVEDAAVVHHHGATIARERNSSANANLELLWTDLLRWALKSRGERWARRASRLMIAAATLRIGAMRLRNLFGFRAEELEFIITARKAVTELVRGWR